ncbi:hypothetical protein HBH69_062280 [Parastagonospora nodorum]|nr:hypothetical protein HBI06_039070 [Parastagonospora nodorum]KAH4239067.1 hypothetical protein HBI05_122050 [Parastagonospora nodorum]KAH5158688.1 hypothetical protein HBH69_062280 [Parastagonospora nodorum]KAH5278899.1 hypothetical protein HBI71_018670 [Parastagonospora nodorum]KAH5336330.1 hypothetical protein HBI12_026830 [Parastagonospora nodorum]
MPPGSVRFPMNIDTDMACPGRGGLAAIANPIILITEESQSDVDGDQPTQEEAQPQDKLQAEDPAGQSWQAAQTSRRSRQRSSPSSEVVEQDEAATAELPERNRKAEAKRESVDEYIACTEVMRRNLPNSWADDEEDDFDPHPDVGRTDIPKSATGEEESVDLMHEILAGPGIAMGDVYIREVDGGLWIWNSDRQCMEPMARPRAVREYGPVYAPGMQALVDHGVHLPKHSILKGANLDGGMSITRDNLEGHIRHWKATNACADLVDDIPTPDESDMIPLSGKLALSVVMSKEQDIEALKGMVAELRRDRLNELLRHPQTQRYTLGFVKDKLAELYRKQKRTASEQQMLEAREVKLDTREAELVKHEQQRRVFGIRKFEEKFIGTCEEVISLVVDNELTTPIIEELARLVERMGDIAERVEESFGNLCEAVGLQQAIAWSNQQEKERTRQLNAEANDLFRSNADASIEIDQRNQQSAKTLFHTMMRNFDDADLDAKAEHVMACERRKMEDEAMLHAQTRLLHIAKTNPAFVKTMAKDIALREKDEDLVETHRRMVRQPTWQPKGKEGTQDMGRTVGVWLSANGGARMRTESSPWYGALEPGHKLSLALAEAPRNDMPYWQGLYNGLAWANQNQNLAALEVAKVSF